MQLTNRIADLEQERDQKPETRRRVGDQANTSTVGVAATLLAVAIAKRLGWIG